MVSLNNISPNWAAVCGGVASLFAEKAKENPTDTIIKAKNVKRIGTAKLTLLHTDVLLKT